MKNRIRKLILVVFTLMVCSAELLAANNTAVTVFEKGEVIPANAVKIRTIVMTGNDPLRSCAAYELEQDAKDSAVAMGANLIREDARRGRSNSYPCDEVTFSFYHVDNIRAAERRFSWSADRPLTWDDFKGRVPGNALRSTAAETSCGISIETNTVTNHNAPSIYVVNTFQTFTSWVRPEQASVFILEHEQCHWDICELYTRIMRARFAKAKIDVHNLQQVVGSIYNATRQEYSDRQQLFETETQHGTIRDQQMKWTAAIQKELAAAL